MALSTANFITNEPRGSQARGAAELGNALAAFALSRATTSAGIAIGTTTTKVQIVSTLAYTVAGKFYSKSATDDFWTLSGTVVPASSFQKYALLIDTAGAASIQGATSNTVSAATVLWTNVSAFSAWAPLLSILGSTKAIAGVITVATDATHTFTPGTTALGAAGITTTYSNGIDQSLLRLMGNEVGNIVGLSG